jgi:hypothetical protein
MFRRASFVLSVCFLATIACVGQQIPQHSYNRLNTFTGFFGYSNDSSHIILGTALNRKIGAVGFQYQRRLIQRRYLDFYYQAEIRPGMLESDPAETATFVVTAPIPQTVTDSSVNPVGKCVPHDTPPFTISGYTYHYHVTCTRRAVVEQGFAPGGIRINLMPRHRLQLTFSSDAGYIFSTQPVPVNTAGSFNFCFDFGGGLEFYRTETQSVRIEYQLQHFSNKDTADQNPGVDSGFVRLAYALVAEIQCLRSKLAP